MTTKIQKWGNSLAVRLPLSLLRKLQLQEGNSVAIGEDRDRIVILRVPPLEKNLRKDAWRAFLIPTRQNKENVSGKIDKILYGVPRR